MTRNAILTTVSTIISLFISAALIGCGKSDPSLLDELQARLSSDITSEHMKLIEITGESIIHTDNGEIDDRVRIAAIIDGLRRLVLIESNWSETDNHEDTLECQAEWDGLKVSARTLRNNGVLIWDVVDVELKSEISNNRSYNWRIQNMKLLLPMESYNLHFKLLEKALSEQGISLIGNYRLGQNVWCEKLSIKRWEQN